ncbi:MAG: MarR family winged helix-turn-helix transcriptional regulator, partial [Candidatus Ornithospirochaeta sp.]
MDRLNFFYLYRLGIRLYDQIAEPVAKRHGLSYMEFVVLMFLANNSEIKKASDVVEGLGIAKSHVSLSLSALEEKGLVERKEDEKDRRASILS